MAQPIVSVLMTAFNREAYIGEAIESVLASDFSDFELIVVDDRSSDRTLEIASGYAKQDARVKVHANPENLGDYPNRNRAASLASGKYIKYLDSDDVIYPHGLGVMVRCMEKYPQAGFGLSQKCDGPTPFPVCLAPRDAYRTHFFVRDLFGRAPGSSIIRRDVIAAIGGFSGRRFTGDQDIWLRLAQSYPMVMMPRDLIWDRTHAGQEQAAEGDTALHDRRMMVIHALESEACPLSHEERRQALERIRTNDAREFWRLVLFHASVKTAFRRRRIMGTPLPAILGYPLKWVASRTAP